MTAFKLIAKNVLEDSAKRVEGTTFFISNGYFPTWNSEYHNDKDRGLKQCSTVYRWKQYQSGKISREKAVELAIKRAVTSIKKETENEIALLERIAAAPDIDYISVSIEWIRSSTWGYNPHATVITSAETTTGRASGCGYDKESAAIAHAFNSSDGILKILCTLKEKGLEAGESDESKITCTGRDNRNICGYGAGYASIPHFEGGVGSSCFWGIFKKCGFAVRATHTKKCDVYTIVKEK